MNSRQRGSLLVLRVLVDLVCVVAAWLAAFYLRFHTIFPVGKGIPEAEPYLKLIPFICGIWVLLLAVSGFYHRSGKQRSAFVEALDILQSSLLATLAFIAFSYFYDEYRYSRVALAVYGLLLPAFVITGRSVVRKALRFYRRRKQPRRLLIVGGGDALRHAFDVRFHNELQRTDVVAVMLLGTGQELVSGQQLCAERGMRILEVPTDWTEFLSSHPVDSVILALPHSEYGFLDQSLETIANQVSDIRVLPDLIKFSRFSPGIELIDGRPIISIHESPLVGWGTVAKRVMDVFGAIVALVIFSPVMLIVGILVPLTSRGPILYAQERMGLDGKTFKILKFRSMPVDAERATGAVWATATDNRPTRLGSILRRTNLDELPQLFNVLAGDMSLVGPRPERPVFVDKFRRNVPGYMLRHKVKAGMTGWAQISGWRGNTSIERRIECDLYYIQNWSVWLDFKIIILTILRSFTDRNAY